MRVFDFKILILAALFAALVVKGGQLCSAEGVQAMTRLVDDKTPSVEPMPLRPLESEFRGVSPLPELSERITPGRKHVKSVTKSTAKKSPKTRSQARQPSGKPDRKG